MLAKFPKSLVLFGAILLLFTFANANEPMVTVKKLDTIEIKQDTTDTTESTTDEDIEEKFIYIEYEDVPTQIYQNQIFELNVKTIITKNKIQDVTSIFTGEEGIKILNPNSSWNQPKNNQFRNKYYIQALNNDIRIPDLIGTFTLDKDTNIDEIAEGFYTSTQPVMGSKDYSSVLAKALEIKHYKTTRYDNTHNILVLELESNVGNLHDFKIENPDIKSQGIDSTFIKMPTTNIVYFAVIPVHWKSFRFEYFNITKSKFDLLEVPIIIDAENISTQSDLNPKDSPFEQYKLIALALLVFIMLVYTILKKSKLVGILTLIPLVVLVIALIPYKKIYIESDSKIRLLPTKNSTIFYITDHSTEVSVMKEIGEYKKVIFKNGKIGWVHEQNIIKD
jgi:hypothetical protein